LAVETGNKASIEDSRARDGVEGGRGYNGVWVCVHVPVPCNFAMGDHTAKKLELMSGQYDHKEGEGDPCPLTSYTTRSEIESVIPLLMQQCSSTQLLQSHGIMSVHR
jgi:hypothetical protein